MRKQVEQDEVENSIQELYTINKLEGLASKSLHPTI